MTNNVINQYKYKVLGVFISLLITIFGQNAWGEDMNILQGNTRFKLAIEGHGIRYFVRVNGVIVFKEYQEKNQNAVEVPINHLMHPETTTFSVSAGPKYAGDKFSATGGVKLTLIIEDRDSEASYRLPILTLDGSEVHKHRDIAGVLVPGHYHLGADNQVNFGKGELELGKISKEEKNDDWFLYSREVTAPNKLPLWAFFNSDTLPDRSLMTKDELISLRKELFVEYKKIQDALAKGDVDSIMPLFAERSREVDLAFDYPAGQINSEVRAFLLGKVNDSDWELQIRKPEGVGAAVLLEKNRKIVSLVRNHQSNLIGFVNIKNGMYSSLPLQYRRENGKWIITR